VIRLYRAVSGEELDDIRKCQKFQPNQSSMGGKWFAESPENAAEWGRRFYNWEAKPFYIVQIELSEFLAAKCTRSLIWTILAPQGMQRGTYLNSSITTSIVRDMGLLNYLQFHSKRK